MIALLLIGGGLYFFFTKVAVPLMDSKRFVDMMLASLARVYPNASMPTKLLITAHAAYESGWGKATAFRGGWNAFNITRLASDTRPVVTGADLEYAPDGSVKKITQRFAKYSSLDESIRDYLSFIQNSRYTNAKALLDAGSMDFVDALSKGGYFTLPLAQYKSTMKSVLSSVTTLAKPPLVS